MVELLTMLFEACGAKYHDKSDLMDEIDVDDVIVALVSCAKQDLYLKYLGWTLNDQVINIHQLIAEDDLGHLYDLLIDDPPEIRHATGALVYDHLITQKFNSSQSGSRGENDNSSKVHLDRMLRILEELPPNPIMTIYVIDDVWDYMKAIKDWKCIISMLLDENSSISDKGATNLVQLLCASVKKAIGERIVPAIDNRKQYHSKAQKDITVAMMESYPLLLRKFISDKAKVSLLVESVLYMKLEFYSSRRQEQNFKNVLQLMKEAFFKHGDKYPLRACVKAINFCCTESQGELQDFARSKLTELEKEIIAKLKSAIREVVNMCLHLSWSLQSIIDGESVSAASLTSLVSKRDALLQELEYFVNLATDSNEGGKSGSELAGRVREL
ncbi:hypothetical protein TSUD_320740 [Trifolium subterraneum]|uniref:Cohesin subunit SCC3/SA HEAT-repeats domain-containing protein n=1 Tax=Trifolium subterraneum TaxID=3900 RepID=A0A2Z6P5V9_TRISU|nr:hypothetical protein TSUD_320740 [Trifolium subterraneum]